MQYIWLTLLCGRLISATYHVANKSSLDMVAPRYCKCTGCSGARTAEEPVLHCRGGASSDLRKELASFAKSTHFSKITISGVTGDVDLERIFEAITTDSLTVQSSHIDVLPTGSFRHLGFHLRHLSLIRDRIKTIESGAFSYLENLVSVRLDDNDLTEINAAIFGDTVSLQTLSLAKNSIRLIDDNAFASLSRLVLLNLQYNQLETLTDHMLTGLRSLRTLLLGFNKLHFISYNAFSDCASLSVLHMAHNRIQGLDLRAMKSVIYLSLSHNLIEVLDSSLLKTFPRLEVLDLTKNRITDLSGHIQGRNHTREVNNRLSPRTADDPDIIIHRFLKQLILSGHSSIRLASESFLRFPALQQLDLTHGRIESIDGRAFAGLKILNSLNLEANHIETLPEATFWNLSMLQILSLKQNKLHSLERGVLRNIDQSLSILDISENPWQCDCDLLWLIDWTQYQTNISLKNRNQLRCQDGKTFANALENLTVQCGKTGFFQNWAKRHSYLSVVLLIVASGAFSLLVLLGRSSISHSCKPWKQSGTHRHRRISDIIRRPEQEVLIREHNIRRTSI